MTKFIIFTWIGVASCSVATSSQKQIDEEKWLGQSYTAAYLMKEWRLFSDNEKRNQLLCSPEGGSHGRIGLSFSKIGRELCGHTKDVCGEIDDILTQSKIPRLVSWTWRTSGKLMSRKVRLEDFLRCFVKRITESGNLSREIDIYRMSPNKHGWQDEMAERIDATLKENRFKL